MEFLVRGAILAIITAVIGLMIKKNNPEMALLLTASAAIVILYFALNMMSGVIEFIGDLASESGISPALLSPVIKCVGIAIVGRLASDVCVDAGQSSTATAVELVAALAAIYVSIPLMRTVMQMLQSFM